MNFHHAFQKIAAFLTATLLSSATVAQGWTPHFVARDGVITAHMGILGTGDVMLLGDSNTEMFWWTTNGGCLVLNAGYGGATISDIAARSAWLASLARPKIVHIMLGTNDLGATGAALDALHDAMVGIVRDFKAAGSVVILWPIPPTSSAFATNADRDAINAKLLAVANEERVDWDWWWPQQITQGGGASGYAAAGALTGDGVHLSTASQTSRYYRFEVWKNYIQQQKGVNCAA